MGPYKLNGRKSLGPHNFTYNWATAATVPPPERKTSSGCSSEPPIECCTVLHTAPAISMPKWHSWKPLETCWLGSRSGNPTTSWSFARCTLPETTSSHLPEGRAPKGNSSSNPSVSGAMLVSERVFKSNCNCSALKWRRKMLFQCCRPEAEATTTSEHHDPYYKLLCTGFPHTSVAQMACQNIFSAAKLRCVETYEMRSYEMLFLSMVLPNLSTFPKGWGFGGVRWLQLTMLPFLR